MVFLKHCQEIQPFGGLQGGHNSNTSMHPLQLHPRHFRLQSMLQVRRRLLPLILILKRLWIKYLQITGFPRVHRVYRIVGMKRLQENSERDAKREDVDASADLLRGALESPTSLPGAPPSTCLWYFCKDNEPAVGLGKRIHSLHIE